MNEEAINERKRSFEVYRIPDISQSKICLQTVANQLLNIAKKFIIQHPNAITQAKEKTKYTELASDGGLYRGLYCPSLVYDIIVGNVTRGRLLRKKTVSDKPYFLYGFDDEGKLIWDSRIYNGCVVLSEIILYCGSIIYGIGIDAYGKLQSVVEERYVDGRIHQYTHALVWQDGSNHRCAKIYREVYTYREGELRSCLVTELLPQGNVCSQQAYLFESDDGNLTNYISADASGNDSTINWEKGQLYKVRIKRKSKYP